MLVILNQGNGTFSIQPTKFLVGFAGNDLTIADFNGDTSLDVAVTDVFDDTITILLNSGDANFPTSTSLLTAAPASAIAAADLDADSDQDIVVAINQTNETTVFWNAGQANFPTSTSIEIDTFSSNLNIADFDCDGREDILVGQVSLLRNLGDSNFAPSEQYFSGGTRFAFGDVNGDNTIDLVSINSSFIQTSLNLISVTGDINRDGKVNLLDVAPFIDLVISGRFQKEADTNFRWPCEFTGRLWFH